MTDQKPTPVKNTTSTSENPKKVSFFGGNQEAFNNLEKFERISNPTKNNEDNQEFDLNFNQEKKDEEELIINDVENSLEDIGFENLFPLKNEENNGEQKNTSEADKTTTKGEAQETTDTTDREVKIAVAPIEKETKNDHPELIQKEKNTGKQEKEKTESEVHEEINDEEKLTEEEKVYREMEKEKTQSDSKLIKKYNELLMSYNSVNKLANKVKKEQSTEVMLIGNNTEKSYIEYSISTDENVIHIKKEEKNLLNQEQYENLLSFRNSNDNLTVEINETVLYQELEDLQDPARANQVLDKMNKFIFLLTEEEKDLEKQWEKIQEENEKMKAFRDIFRNF